MLIAELIDTKIYDSVNQFETKPNELIRCVRPRDDGEWDSRSNTPQYIAKKYLETTVQSIYNILYLAIRRNRVISERILEYD